MIAEGKGAKLFGSEACSAEGNRRSGIAAAAGGKLKEYKASIGTAGGGAWQVCGMLHEGEQHPTL
jgi:hypothetical protein